MKKKKLVIVTTVPITAKAILFGQFKDLNEFYEVFYISNSGPELLEVSEHENVPVYPVDMYRGINPFKDAMSIFRMVRLLKIINPDAIHSYTPKAGLVAMFSGLICRVPVRIHTFTGLVFPTSALLKRILLKWIDRLICACATIIIPEGRGVKNDLIYNNITSKTLKLIGNGNIAGVNTEYFSKSKVAEESECLKESLNLPDDAFVFLYVGRLTLDKGVIELYEAFCTLPQNAYLLIVGDNDARLPLSSSFLETISKNSRVTLLGWKDDVRPAMACSDIFVLPSYREGFPNTPMQAGSMQLPCIVTDVNGSNEIIQQGFNGWIVKKKDILDLARKMDFSMRSDEIEVLGYNARANIEDKFERTYYLNCLSRFYKENI